MKLIGRPILAVVRGGRYASQSAAAAKPAKQDQHHKFSVTRQDPKVTSLPNGVTVASLETYAPVSRVGVFFAAGSRHESPDNLGITHLLRRAGSNISTERTTAFKIAKLLQQDGANLECETTREYVAYTIKCLRPDLELSVSLLGQVATQPVFKPWELDRLNYGLRLDLDRYHHSPEAELTEKLHAAAYRDTLGHSLYMHSDCIGHFSLKALEQFVGARYGPKGAVVAGVGVDHDQLVQLVTKGFIFHKSSSAPAETKKAVYHGGEQRVQRRGHDVHAALVMEGPASGTPEALAASLLHMALGVGPLVERGPNAVTPIGKAVGSFGSSHAVAAGSVSVGYSDSGLFGFRVVAGAKDVRKVLGAVLGAVQAAGKGNLPEADLKRAKAQLKSAYHVHHECPEVVLDSIGRHALLTGKVHAIGAHDAAIDKISAADVGKVAQKILSGKPSFAAVGDLRHTPYLDELLPSARA